MDFTFDAEHEALRDAVRGLFSKVYDTPQKRRSATNLDPGWDEELWQRLADMGVLGLPFAEADGGMGAGPVEVSIIAEEIGRVIAPEPFIEAVVLAGGLVAVAGSVEQRAEILGTLSAGTLVPTFAHTEPGARYEETASGVTAIAPAAGSPMNAAWSLSGIKEPVLGAARADLFVVSAALPEGGIGLFLLQPDATGLTKAPYRTFDGGRAARVTLDDTPGTPLGEPGADQSSAIAITMARALIAYAHEAVGSMDAALDITVDYLKARKQFGAALGTFQSLRFRAADMYVSLELARSTVLWATLVALEDDDSERVVRAASRAKVQIGKAGRHIGQEAIQLHGGIGMTAEYSIGHHTSRLTAIDHLLGDGHHHLASLSARLTEHDVVDLLT